MKTTKLIPMTDFVLEQQEKFKSDKFYYRQFKDNVVNYARFLKQPLELWMFVPCDEEGNVLEEPYKYMDIQTIGSMNSFATEQECSDSEAFHKAKEKVLFEGFEPFNSKSNPDVINKELRIIICFNKIISVMIEGNNGYGGFSDSNISIEKLTELNIQLTPTALKQIYG